jgi:hypothetical protein
MSGLLPQFRTFGILPIPGIDFTSMKKSSRIVLWVVLVMVAIAGALWWGNHLLAEGLRTMHF